MEVAEEAKSHKDRARMFKINKYQVFMAATALQRILDKKTPFLRIRPGGGKSFIILLICLWLAKHKPEVKVTVATMNEILQNQMLKHANQFALPDTQFRLWYQLPSTKSDLVIFDEYYHHVRISKLNFTKKGVMNVPTFPFCCFGAVVVNSCAPDCMGSFGRMGNDLRNDPLQRT